MSQYLLQSEIDSLRARARNLITEDGEPVDNIFSDIQRRLLVEPLKSSWRPINEETGEPMSFIAQSDVGVFLSVNHTPVAPDMFLSVNVSFPPDVDMSETRSYFVWEFGKMPEVAVEVVSNTKGGEISKKKNRYAEIQIPFYVVFDPFNSLGDQKLRVYELGFGGRRYLLRKDFQLPEIGLSLKLWRGDYEGHVDEWLRWCDLEGNLILTGKELALKEKEFAEMERERADYETERADAAEAEVARLLAELQKLKEKK